MASTTTMQSPSRLELLQPEIQTLIMRNISGVNTLQSLLHASPRFYQVFSTRRNYHLTELAFRQFDYEVYPFACDAIRAARIPKPMSRAMILEFLDTFWNNEEHYDVVLPPETTIPLIKLGTRIRWFVSDMASNCLRILAQLGDMLGLQKDLEVLHSRLSATETARMQRAFCRFEMYRHLYTPGPFVGSFMSTKEQAYSFLDAFDAEEVEELACVRDYFVRRLWWIFDTMEDNFVAEQLSEPDRQAQQPCGYWYNEEGKDEHDVYIERIMSGGLPLLQDIFTTDTKRATNLILLNSVPLPEFLSEALLVPRRLSDDAIKAVSAELKLCPLKFSGDDVYQSSIGWLWGHDWKPSKHAGEPQMKGLRDWGYVFWDERRMRASGILDRWYKIDKPILCSNSANGG